MCLHYKSFEKTVGKGEIARFSPFRTLFSTHLENFLPFSSNLKVLSANSFRLEEFEICRLGKDEPFIRQQNFSINSFPNDKF